MRRRFLEEESGAFYLYLTFMYKVCMLEKLDVHFTREAAMKKLELQELEVPIFEKLRVLPLESWKGHLEDAGSLRYLSAEMEIEGLGRACIELSNGGTHLHLRIGWKAEGDAYVGPLGMSTPQKDQLATPIAREIWTKVWKHRDEERHRAEARMQEKLKQAFK